jgi:acetyl-CoA acetyltransferase
MTGFDNVALLGGFEVPYRRHADTDTVAVLTAALSGVLAECGVPHDAVDGLGVASFTLPPDHAIDFAWRTGLSPRWCMDDCHGGASGINLLQHAARAIQSGDASVIVLVSGDHFAPSDFTALVENYNRTTRAHLKPLNTGGPNPLFAMLTQRQMRASGLVREDYAALCIAQRAWAAKNPAAVYREPLTLAAYLASPMVADPLCRFDCVPVVTGANALVLTAADHPLARQQAARGRTPVSIRSLRAAYNVDRQEGDGLRTGLHELRDALWSDAGIGPDAVDMISVYDDYPSMVLAQLADLGFAADGDLPRLIHDDIATHRLAVNTSGGQLSAGQAGAAAGMHGLTEAVRQLQHTAGERQVPNARLAAVSGYGMVQYRYGMCANAVIIERGAA